MQWKRFHESGPHNEVAHRLTLRRTDLNAMGQIADNDRLAYDPRKLRRACGAQLSYNLHVM